MIETKEYWQSGNIRIFKGVDRYDLQEIYYSKIFRSSSGKEQLRWIPIGSIDDEDISDALDLLKNGIKVAPLYINSKAGLGKLAKYILSQRT